MPSWKKVITSGSNAELNNLVVNNISASGQVGIGTSTPQYDLHINPPTGNASLMIQSENSFTSELLMHFQGYNNNNEIWKLYGSSAESTAGLSFNTNAFGDVMTLRGNGNVGIGTTSPSTKLHVNGTVSASKFETEGQISASLFSGSFVGDGSGLTGISAGGGGIFAQTGSYYSTTNNLQITGSLELYKSGSTVFSIEGSQGTLFSVTDSLSGSLFSVNDISGIPIFEVFSDDTVKIGTYNSEAIVVNGSSAIITGSFTGSFVGNGGGLIGIVSSSYAVSSSFASDIPNNLKTYRLELGVSSTSPITTGEKGRKIVPYTGTIVGWKLIADQSTTTTLDIWKRNNSIPDVTYTITGTAKPSLSAATLATSTTLTGWTTSVSPDDVFVLNVDSNDNATYLLLELDILLT